MSITTGIGDNGSSGLIGGRRLPKNHPRFEAYGTVDEAQSAIGMVRAMGGVPPDLDRLLSRAQVELFSAGAELASIDPEFHVATKITSLMIQQIEQDIRHLETQAGLPPLRNFIVPGGSPAAATCFWARAVVRRAERHVAGLMHDGQEVETVLVYLNRLGDLLFLIARALNKAAGIDEQTWSGHGIQT